MQRKKSVAKKRKQKELTGLLLLALGVFLFACIFTSATGILGKNLSGVIFGLFGLLAYLIPVVVFSIGVFIIMKSKKQFNMQKAIVLVLISFVLVNFIHIFFLNSLDKTNYLDFVSSSYYLGFSNHVGMGAFGALLSYVIFTFIGTIGSYVFFGATLIALGIIYANLSLKSVGEGVKTQYKSMKKVANNAKEVIVQKRAKAKLYIENNEKDTKRSQPEIDLVSYKPKPMFEELEVSKYEPVEKKPIKQNFEIKTETKDPKSTTKIKPAFPTHESVKPLLSMLKTPVKIDNSKNKAALAQKSQMLEETLESFGVNAKVVHVTCGPSVTRFELQPAQGVKISKIVSLTNDIKMSLAAADIRLEAPIPGKSAVGIEIPNDNVRMVYLREVLEDKAFLTHKSNICFALGIDIDGSSIVADLERMPHLLIAGTTGSGKSVCINNLILSILYRSTPEQVRMIMVDPKMVELASYNDIPHLLIPVVTDSKKAAGALRWALNEMELRYKEFSEAGVRQLSTYNANADKEQQKPSIVVIVDELADLMMVAAQEVEEIICRIAQKGRAAGIHLVLATQRPSVNVITGTIKANIPSRIAFQVYSQIDSRTILDMAGAERLLGRGDMLYHPNGAGRPTRLQGAFVSEEEVQEITSYIRSKSQAEYNEDVLQQIEASQVENSDASNDDGYEYDELLPEAAKIFMERKEASISLLQRKMRIGYARSARIVDEMETMGIVSGPDGSKPRSVLISHDDYNRIFNKGDKI